MCDCNKFQDLINERAERALTENEQRELDSHVADCEACRGYSEDMAFLRKELAATGTPFPQDLHKRIMDDIEAEIKKTTIQVEHPVFRLPVLTMVVAAAACIALVATGVVGDVMNLILDQNGAATGDAMAAGAPPMMSQAAPEAESALDDVRGFAKAAPPEEAAGGGGGSEDSTSHELPDSLAGLRVAFAYQVSGGTMPAFEGQLLDETDGVRYYEVTNNMTTMEQIFDAAEKAGCTVGAYDATGIMIDSESEIGLLAVVQ